MIEWFKNIDRKSDHIFILFDIMEFYPSISEKLLKSAQNYANDYKEIPDEDIEIIMHSRKSLPFNNNEPWVKKESSSMFDVTMGSSDGAKICELVGLYILHKLNRTFEIGNIGLYRDDGLAAFKNVTPRSADLARKKLSKVFNELGLKITVETNLKIVNFLDVTLNQNNGSYSPYRKPGSQQIGINLQMPTC